MDKIVKKRWVSIICYMVSIIIFTCEPSFAAYFSTNAGCDNNLIGAGGGIIYNQNGVNNGIKLPAGCVIQYIYAGLDDTINSIDPVTGAPTGDDAIVDNKIVGDDSVYNAFNSTAGIFFHRVNGTYASGSPKIYLRIWNAASISSSSYYGETSLFSPATNNVSTPTPNNVGIPNIITNKPFSSTPIPMLQSVSPSSAYKGDILDITITGQNTNFINTTSSANFGSNIIVNSLTVTGTTAAKANITIGTSASTGSRNIFITTNSETAEGSSLFTVSNPSIQTANPSSGILGWTGNVVVSGIGTHFKSGTTADFGSGITVNSVSITNAASLTANISIESGASAGARNVVIATNLGSAGTESLTGTSAFTINSPAPSNPSTTIDNFEESNGVIYYKAGEVVPTEDIDTSVKYSGNSSRKISYSYPSGSNAWGGLVGAVLPQDLDLASANGVSFWLKGDGSNNTIRLDLKESNVTPANGEVYSSPLISLLDTSWHKISIKFDQFTRNPYDGVTGGNSTFDKNINQYQWIYLGKNSSSSAHYVDDLTASDVSFGSIDSIAANSAKQGTTLNINIVGSGTHFDSSSVLTFEGSGISVNFSQAADATHLNAVITISGSAPIGSRTVSVSTGGETAQKTGAFEILSSAGPSQVVDNMDGSSGQINYAKGDIVPAYLNDSSVKYEGNSSLKILYSYPLGSTGWGGLIGTILPSTMDLSSVNGISFWLKGDGSKNTVRLDLKESTSEAPANGEVYSSSLISLTDTSWHKIKIPFTDFTRNIYDGITGGNGVFDKKISQYQFVYTGRNVSTASHYVDLLMGETLNPPTKVSSFSGSASSSTQIIWSWVNNSANETGFKIYDGSNELKLSAAAGSNSAIEAGLNPNTPYTRYISVYNEDGSISSNPVTVFTKANPPKNMKQVSSSVSGIKFTWDAGDGGAAKYNIYRAVDNGGKPGAWVKIKDSLIGNSFEDSGLSPNTKYWYGISSLNSDGSETIVSTDISGSGVMSALTSSDTTPPVISQVTFNGKTVFAGDFVSFTPQIKAIITDDIMIDPLTITVEAGDTYNSSSDPKVTFEASTGLMILALTKPLPGGDIVIKIHAKDTSNNETIYSIKLKVEEANLFIEGSVFNYPNPFNPLAENTKIGFNLSQAADASLYIFDMTGQIVMKKVISGTVGYNEVQWSGANDFGEITSNGVYLIRITSNNKLIGKGKIWVIKK